LAVCDRLHVSPSNVAYVGDTPLDVDCARAAGCFAIKADWAGDSTEVSATHAVAATPGDVLRLVVPGLGGARRDYGAAPSSSFFSQADQ
jgi:phosphoglycolate phosphatase-like HAD superfamily hydrolase